MTNTRVKFFFTSPSERECFVYVERGRGFTDPRQFPQLGNPWLKDLGPEEFGYHVHLAWPIPREEYERRDALPMPSWDDVPGGDFYPVDRERRGEEEDAPTSGALPREFLLIHDEEWAQQVGAIQALFATEEGKQDPLPPDSLFGEAVEGAATGPTPQDVRRMRQEVLDSIAERGPDRSKCILQLLFENHLKNVETAPSWKDLWKACWKEPLDTRRGADVHQSATVRQAVSRARDQLDRYFSSDAGKIWKDRAVIEPHEYRVHFKPNIPNDLPPEVDREGDA
jgi:hypothetical protein